MNSIVESATGKIQNCDCLGFMKQLPDKCIDLTFTSPPYNRLRNDKYEFYSDTKKDYFLWLDSILFEIIRCSSKTIFNIQATSYNRPDVYKLIGKYSEKIKEILIWEKLNPLPASGNSITNAYEFIFLIGDEPFKTNKTYIKNTIHTSVCSDMPEEHKAVMDLGMCINTLETFGGKYDMVFDPFMGSGTTAVACERLGKKWLGCEIELKYVDMADKRIEAERNQLKLF